MGSRVGCDDRISFYSIKTSMIISFMLLISILVLFLSLMSYRYTMNDFQNMSINYTVRLLNEINFNIDSYINNMKSMAQVVVENKDVRSLMAYFNENIGKPISDKDMKILNELKNNASTHMEVVANTRNDITNIAVISKYGNVVLSNKEKKVNEFSEYNLTDWFLKPLSYKDDILVSPSHVQNLISGEYKWVISISKAITDARTGEVTGVMVIDLNYQSIENICENAQLGKNGYIYLIDSKKNIIYHPQQQLIYSGIKTELIDELFSIDASQGYVKGQDNRIYTKNDSAVTGWSAVGVVNTEELIKNKSNIINFYICLAGVAILFATAIATIISTTITNPIKKLETSMHEVEDGNFNVQTQIALNNEIGHLSKTFDTMLIKIKLLMQNAVSNEEEKRKIEIKALQAQINPHFLYNTLDTIIWMSASGKSDEVVEVTSALAHLFRTSISKGDNLVPLTVEIENIKSYLTIQKMRYKDKLRYSVEIPEGLQNLQTPKLILQPIVENAVYHGIKLSQMGGEIKISAQASQTLLTITVEDSGVGMTQQQLDQIFVHKDNSDRGIGILNVQNRIKLCFGEEYGLRFRSNKGEGTRVDICMPVIVHGEEVNG